MLKVGIWVGSFSCAGILLLQSQLKLSTQMPPLNIFELRRRFRKSVEYLLRYRNFAGTVYRLKVAKFQQLSMGKVFTWPLQKQNSCAPETFYPNGHRQHLRAERKISKIGWISLEIEDFCSHSVHVESGKISNVVDVQRFHLAIAKVKYLGKVKTLHIGNIWNFATFNPYTVRAEILYLQRYSTNFRNLSLSSKMLTMAIWVESFRCAGILLLQWPDENFAHRQLLKFCHFQALHCARKIPISQKVFHRFSKSLPQLEDAEGGHLGGKVHERTYFTFAMARCKLCASTKFEIFPNSTCSLCQQKSNICKDIQPIFEIFPSTRRCWGWELGRKVSYALVFYFCNGKVKTFRIHNIWNFATFNLHTVTAKSYICKGIQSIFKIFASARRYWGWAFGWKVSIAQAFYCCNGKVKTLRIDNIGNFATFNLYTVSAKILYLQKYSTDFRNLCSFRRCWGWAFGRRVLWVQVFYFCNGCWNFAHRQHLKFCQIQPVHCASKNPISAKVFPRYSKSLPQLEAVEGGHPGGKFQVRRYFTFAMARWKLCTSTTYEILPNSTGTLCQQNPISPKVFKRFSKSWPQLEDIEGGNLGGNFQGRRQFTVAMARWKLCVSTTLEKLPNSTGTLCQEKSNISKDIQPIFEIFASTRRCWGENWWGGGKVSYALVFYFCNGKVKTFRIYNNWNYATFNLYTVPAKSYISKCIQPIFEIFASARRYWGRPFGW